MEQQKIKLGKIYHSNLPALDGIHMGKIYKKTTDGIIRHPTYFIPLKVEIGTTNAGDFMFLYEGIDPENPDSKIERVSEHTLKTRYILAED